MRAEQEMFDLILGVAKADERIRAVYMNGSRTNPNVLKDKFQDYDIVFVVTETKSFIDDKDWIFIFGNPLIVQEPDWNDNSTGWFSSEPHDFTRRYAWLMLFDDGSRIDLGLEIREEAEKNFIEDKLTIAFLDKDNILPGIPAPSDIDYHVNMPTESEYLACFNEFWWCLNNVAKGITRDELPYAIGWTVDLQMTFDLISSYLKIGGVFIFSWDHPFMYCVDTESEKLIFSGSYFKKN